MQYDTGVFFFYYAQATSYRLVDFRGINHSLCNARRYWKFTVRFFTDLLRFSCSAEFVAEWAEQNSNQIFEFVSSHTWHTCALHQI